MQRVAVFILDASISRGLHSRPSLPFCVFIAQLLLFERVSDILNHCSVVYRERLVNLVLIILFGVYFAVSFVSMFIFFFSFF